MLKRATTHTILAFLGMSTGVAAVTNESIYREVEPWQVILVLGGFLVLFAGAVTLAWIRWLNKVERNVPRDPHRIEGQLTSIMNKLDRQDKRLDVLSTRLARLEGYVNQPIILRNGD